jgi:hypothetical protein
MRAPGSERQATVSEATARIDALCPWLVGVEIGAAKRRLRLAAAAR